MTPKSGALTHRLVDIELEKEMLVFIKALVPSRSWCWPFPPSTADSALQCIIRCTAALQHQGRAVNFDAALMDDIKLKCLVCIFPAIIIKLH